MPREKDANPKPVGLGEQPEQPTSMDTAEHVALGNEKVKEYIGEAKNYLNTLLARIESETDLAGHWGMGVTKSALNFCRNHLDGIVKEIESFRPGEKPLF